MNKHHVYLIEQFQQASQGEALQRPEHVGTPHTYYGLRNDKRRDIIQTWINQNKKIDYETWVALVDRLYRGQSYEEHCTPPTLFVKFPKYRQQVPLSQLDIWFGLLDGWAEVDSTCYSVFTAKEMLDNWDNWQTLLEQLIQDDNINKRRASLVLLTKPLSKSPDERLLKQSLATVEALKHEKHKLITKAISWLLRQGIAQHRAPIEQYLAENEASLPAIAVRETRKKLTTGKK